MTTRAIPEQHDALRIEIRHIAEEIRPLTDAVDSLYILLDHVWRNREEIFEMMHGYSAEERDTIRCERCSESTDLGDAITDEWKNLRNEAGRFWGLCPNCCESAENYHPAEEVGEILSYCCQTPRLVWSGDSDCPGVVCRSCGFVVAENGGLIVRTEEEIKEERKPRNSQGSLFKS